MHKYHSYTNKNRSYSLLNHILHTPFFLQKWWKESSKEKCREKSESNPKHTYLNENIIE